MLALTTLTMGAVFSLLARGMKTTPRDAARADLQAQARHALELISRDVLLAGSDLPPEFPAFTPPEINPTLAAGAEQPNTIEIIGNLDSNITGQEPIEVLDFDGYTARLKVAPAHIREGDLVLLYDDAPEQGKWVFGLVSSIQIGSPPRMTLETLPGDSEGDITLPPFIQNYNRPSPTSGFLTPVTVVTYTTSPAMTESDSTDQVLWRQLNWGAAHQVASVEDLQIRYFVGGTLDEINIPKDETGDRGPSNYEPRAVDEGRKHRNSPRTHDGPARPPHTGHPSGPKSNRSRSTLDPVTAERELASPPVPQPDSGEPLINNGLVRGVRITVTSRSQQANLESSTVRWDQEADEDGYLRVTYSSRVATRNILCRLSSRKNLGAFN